MKNKIFSPGLFWETFRQLKIVGVLGTVLYCCFGILLPIGINVDMAKNIPDYVQAGFYNKRVETIPPETVIIPSIIMAVVFVPVMMLVAFHFINKRNSCDFYHAIPVKRLAMYISIILAVLAWTCIMLILPVAVLAGMCGVLQYVTVSLLSVAEAVVKALAVSVFILGVFSIGISLSGTLFTNILVSLMILVTPRVLIFIYMNIIGGMAECYPAEEIMGNFFGGSNVLTQSVLWFDYYIGKYASVIPTVIEGLCYCVAGGAVFVHRKSETAQKPSLNRGVQNVLRIIPAYILGTLGIGFIPAENFYGIVFFVVCILMYFIYELLTSRKWHAVLKSIKQLPILIGLLLVTFFAVKIISSQINSYRIDAEKVQYIEIKDVQFYSYLSDDFDWESIDRKIDDYQCIKELADACNAALDADADAMHFNHEYDTVDCILAIKENGTIYNRSVSISSSVLSDAMRQITAQNNISLEKYLPEDLNNITLEINDCTLSPDKIKELYKCLKSDIEENNNFIEVMMTSWRYAVNYMYIGYSGPDYYKWREIPISYNTPKTLELLSQLVEEVYNIEHETYWERVNDIFSYGGYIDLATIDIYIKTDDGLYTYDLWFDSDDIIDDIYNSSKITEILNRYGQKGCATGENTVIISGYASFEYDENHEADNMQFLDVYSLTDEGMKQFIDVCNEIEICYD